MKKGNKNKILYLFISIFILAGSEKLDAYIGPGAGFAFISSFFILFITFSIAVLTIIFWPVRLIVKSLTKKKPPRTKHDIQRVVIVGLDGMDPDLTAKYMKEGKLPNFSRLSSSGSFKKLQTTLPAMSPVAWSSFITGVDPSRHNIFDFLSRNERTYLPELSSTKIEKPSKFLPVGRYLIPLGKSRIKLLRKGRPFWNTLDEYGIFSSIIRVPMTFPPEKLHGTLLSSMCIPDLKGTQGTFTFYTSNRDTSGKRTGGIQIPVNIEGGKIKTYIPGPENYILKQGGELQIPLEITLNGDEEAELRLCKQKLVLKKGLYSRWIKLTFRPGLNIKIYGICRFFIKQIYPCFEMYMTPINIDPEKPSFPISYPVYYSMYLSKMMGSYATLGLAEDTWALNEGVIDEDAFLEQVYKNHQEREKMFFNALDKTRKGLCVCVFDATDRIQHMFFRCLDEKHPANTGKEVTKYKNVIEDLYVRMDTLIGRVLKKIGRKTLIMVISDHGFVPFKKGVNLNTWLFQNGYLSLKDGKTTSGDWFEDVDWERTRVYSLGLAGLYINRKGRELNGIVGEGNELLNLKQELIVKLTGLIDEEEGEIGIKKVIDTEKAFSGPYKQDAPDLLIGYNSGYRNSWDGVIGRVAETVFSDNIKHWSGDHCVDPQFVPGVFFVNRKINKENPDIKDIAPTTLELFGIDIPFYMQGTSLIGNYDGEKQNAKDYP
jgi:predicted AlkP superfamily phosphohydrolase/phosphomutase